jgi:hypothetical protein
MVTYPAIKVSDTCISSDAKGKALAKTAGNKWSAGSSSKKPHSHSVGYTNYSAKDMEALLNILNEHLLLGGKAWNIVRKWARGE